MPHENPENKLDLKINYGIPRIMISAINGGSGKTFITTGLIAALAEKGFNIAPFKKGPDYIDAKWLGLVSGRPCYNLDVFLFEKHVMDSFIVHSQGADLAIIEGNHGLYDSIDTDGRGSSAYLSRMMQTPVILIVNCNKLSRSVAAIIQGFVNFEPETKFAGVILNHVSGRRHEDRLREAISIHCNLPVLGVVYKSVEVELEQRHIGIITTEEKKQTWETLGELKKIARESLDLDKIIEIAQNVSPLPQVKESVFKKEAGAATLKIAVAKDSAFNFYYPDNLQALRDEGAELLEFSPIQDPDLPKVDAVYIGGGYPELFADQLEKNYTMRDQLKKAIQKGLPVYAECGGLMYLTQSIKWGDESHQMVGVLPGDTVMKKTPQGRGYVELETSTLKNEDLNWRIPAGEKIRAHEFHYSRLENLRGDHVFAFEMKRGSGIIKNHDGIILKNVLALYTHLHALSAPWWASSFAEIARAYKKSRG